MRHRMRNDAKELGHKNVLFVMVRSSARSVSNHEFTNKLTLEIWRRNAEKIQEERTPLRYVRGVCYFFANPSNAFKVSMGTIHTVVLDASEEMSLMDCKVRR